MISGNGNIKGEKGDKCLDDECPNYPWVCSFLLSLRLSTRFMKVKVVGCEVGSVAKGEVKDVEGTREGIF